ncbi:MAG: 2-hydroxychromene-2-carboxylate isomerase [Pseudomonadota bacterium]
MQKGDLKMNVEFYFDFGSPTAYLANGQLQKLCMQYDAGLVYKPVLLGGIFKATGNAPPAAVPAKGVYMNNDLPRFAERYGMLLNFNPHFPVNTLQLMRGVYAARELGVASEYIETMFKAMWVDEKNMGEMEVVAEVLGSAGLDAAAIAEKIVQPEIKQALIADTEAAVNRGLFGAPTIFLGEEMFFGQDRLDFVEERLAAA